MQKLVNYCHRAAEWDESREVGAKSEETYYYPEGANHRSPLYPQSNTILKDLARLGDFPREVHITYRTSPVEFYTPYYVRNFQVPSVSVTPHPSNIPKNHAVRCTRCMTQFSYVPLHCSISLSANETIN